MEHNRRRPARSPEFVEDLDEDLDEAVDEDEPVAVPEPLRGVKVEPPFQVVHNAQVYLPGDVATVPASLAEEWILNQWVEESA